MIANNGIIQYFAMNVLFTATTKGIAITSYKSQDHVTVEILRFLMKKDFAQNIQRKRTK